MEHKTLAKKNETPQKEQKKSLLPVIIVLLLTFCLILVFYDSKPKSKGIKYSGEQGTAASQKRISEREYSSINKYMQRTGEKVQYAQQKIKSENAKLAPKLQYSPPTVDEESLNRDALRMKPENPEALVADYLRSKNSPPQPDYNNPKDQVISEIQRRQEEQEYLEAYKKEYVKAFIENARRHGYRVRVNKDLTVTDVSPIAPGSRDPSSTSNPEKLPQ